MRKTIIKSGVISGLLMSAFMAATLPIVDKIGAQAAQILGYVCMVVAFLPIYFGIRSYRDNISEGNIAFSRAVAMAMLCACIASLFYVVTWLIIYYSMPDQMAKVIADGTAQMKAAGKTQQEIDAAIKQVQEMSQLLKNPWINAAITFTQPLPMALIFSLLTGLILKRKPATGLIS